ncbi:unnamed protein product [Tilletia laevis]|nr:hypothetical protein CF336_g6069 [Tilletia laevis]CAD6885409.1 unnamed protein product [Tilletia caries]CAD6902962.1 unnamed protein product [Tilletia laevis]
MAKAKAKAKATHAKKDSTSSIEDERDGNRDLDSEHNMDIDGDEDEDDKPDASPPPPPPARNTATPFQHPDIVARLPVYLSLSLANMRAGNATAGTGGPSPFPFAQQQQQQASAAPGTPKPGPTLHTFHYPILPARHPLPVPESARARNVRPTMRWKSRNNIVQVELPLDNHPAAYNEYKGEELERGAERARKLTGAPGMAAAAAAAARPSSRSKSKEDDPSSSSSASAFNRTGKLDRTRLESIESPQHHSDAFIGVIRSGALHLTPIDSMAQLRPTMHYLDALDEIDKMEKKRARAVMAAAAAGASDMELSGMSSGDELASGPGGARPPSAGGGGGGASNANAKKAVNMTVSMRGEAGDSKRMGGGPGGSGGARFGNSLGAGADARDALMGSIWDAESERWMDLEWHDEESTEAEAFFEDHFFAQNTRPLVCKTRQAEYVCT